MKRWKKPLWITLAVIGGLLLLAVAVGVLNALVGGGEWTFGWNAYRYDDEGYTVGDGTVYADSLKELNIDWIDGDVEIVICQDAYPSVSERVSGDTPESGRMRYRVSDDGQTLSVKYRAPSMFLGVGESRRKNLTVRIPEKMLSGMETLRVSGKGAELSVEAIPFASVFIEGTSGDVSLAVNPATERIFIETTSGNVTLFMDGEPSFSLAYETARGGSPLIDFPHKQAGGGYVCGDGAISVSVETVSGELSVKKKN